MLVQDHWGPLLGLDDGSGRATSVLIREFKQKHGELAWGAKEDELLRWANKELNSTTGIWEVWTWRARPSPGLGVRGFPRSL